MKTKSLSSLQDFKLCGISIVYYHSHSSLAEMEEVKRSKLLWVYSNPTSILYTVFSYKYMSYLLPALLNAKGNSKTAEIEKIVRFEVDMALVTSTTDEFKWSRALKQKLEKGKNASKLHLNPECRRFGILEKLCCLRRSPAIQRPIFVVDSRRPKRIGRRKGLQNKVLRGEEELRCQVRILRQILPGGNEMEDCELLSEVQSYVVCLQLQVNILRSLVYAH